MDEEKEKKEDVTELKEETNEQTLKEKEDVKEEKELEPVVEEKTAGDEKVLEAEIVKEKTIEPEIIKQENEKNNKSGFATASLVLGIIAAAIICTSKLSSICAILAIIFACIGKDNKGAKAGLILGIVVLSLDFLFIILGSFFAIAAIPLMALNQL